MNLMQQTWEEKMKYFFQSGSENRELIAYLAYRSKIPWPYGSVSLEEAIRYLKFKMRKSSTEKYCWTLIY